MATRPVMAETNAIRPSRPAASSSEPMRLGWGDVSTAGLAGGGLVQRVGVVVGLGWNGGDARRDCRDTRVGSASAMSSTVPS